MNMRNPLPVATGMALTLAHRLVATRFGGAAGGGLVRDMVTRYTGLIVIAMGIQCALTGVKSFMGFG